MSHQCCPTGTPAVPALPCTAHTGAHTHMQQHARAGNTRVVTVTDMVRTLEKLLKKEARIEYVALGATGDVLRTNANITGAQKALG